MRTFPLIDGLQMVLKHWWDTKGFGKYASRGEILNAIEKSLMSGPKYSWEIIQDIEDLTKKKLFMRASSLYPLLSSLEESGVIESFLYSPSTSLKRVRYWRLKS